jgi:16S rRNA (cytidine1402-2'-O)-methyltransferase
LYIVATPIGNTLDITLRALKVLSEVDAIICEELRQGSRLLKKLDITARELIVLNEHNESTQAAEIVSRLLNGQSIALISDCGTPVFADPGYFLIRQAIQAGLDVTPVPGPSSLSAILSILDFKLEKFVFGGFLPRTPVQRNQELKRLRSLNMPIILMDTPYRMVTLLDEVSRVFGKKQHVTLACNLTMSDEKIYRGSVLDVRNNLKTRKAEFVLVIH